MGTSIATDTTFEPLVLASPRPVLVDFWADWAGPCKLLVPELDKLAAKYEGVVDVVTLDIEANPAMSAAFNIQSIPTIGYFRPGRLPQFIVGFRPAEQLEAEFEIATNPIAVPLGTGAAVLDQVRKLGELRDAGVLTEDEFAIKKRVLLEQL